MSLAWQTVSRRLESWPRRVRERRPRPTLAAPELARRVAALDLAAPHDLAVLVEEVADLLEEGTLHSTHPRYFGLFVPGVRPAGVLGDTLAALYNPQVAAAWHAPAASALEEAALAHLRRRLGFPDAAHASFTSGGSEANFSAVLAALAHAFPEAGEAGLAAQPAAPVFYASDQAHDSLLKIAHAAGLGRRALRRVPSDARQTLRVDALRAQLAADRAAGLRPFMVVATCGTTATGALDPLDALADLCAAEGLWLHADAAWGGLGLLSDRLRPHVAALARADSVTWDAHKTLPVPMGAGMFFCRHRAAAEAAHHVRPGYVPDGATGERVPYTETLQWSRRAIGLKVFLTLAELGAAGIAALVDTQAALADRLRAGLTARGLHVVNDTPLPLVCFVDDRVPAEALASVEDAWISVVRLPSGKRWARACVTGFDTTAEDVDAVVEAVGRVRERRNGNRKQETGNRKQETGNRRERRSRRQKPGERSNFSGADAITAVMDESRRPAEMRLGKSIAERLMVFTVTVVKMAGQLPRDIAGRHVASQLIRSATSAGANYEEARAAESRDDFVHKVSIAAKEARETIFWLEFIRRSGWMTTDTQEARELAAILGASARTARKTI